MAMTKAATWENQHMRPNFQGAKSVINFLHKSNFKNQNTFTHGHSMKQARTLAWLNLLAMGCPIDEVEDPQDVACTTTIMQKKIGSN